MAKACFCHFCLLFFLSLCHALPDIHHTMTWPRLLELSGTVWHWMNSYDCCYCSAYRRLSKVRLGWWMASNALLCSRPESHLRPATGKTIYTRSTYYKEFFTSLWNSLKWIPMPLYDLHKQTRPSAGRLAMDLFHLAVIGLDSLWNQIELFLACKLEVPMFTFPSLAVITILAS